MPCHGWIASLNNYLSKAFELFPHNRLIHKLKGYDKGNELLEWFGYFLVDRKHRMVQEESISNWKTVLSGVESVLSPLLFFSYMTEVVI